MYTIVGAVYRNQGRCIVVVCILSSVLCIVIKCVLLFLYVYYRWCCVSQSRKVYCCCMYTIVGAVHRNQMCIVVAVCILSLVLCIVITEGVLLLYV